jgi:hypothetical protein
MTRKQNSHPVKDSKAANGTVGATPAIPSGIPAFSNEPVKAPLKGTNVERSTTPATKEDLRGPRGQTKGSGLEEKPAPGTEIPRAPASPREDPAFQAAKRQVHTEAVRQKKHDPADQKRIETEKASAITEDEQRNQSAREKSTDEMEKIGAQQQTKGQQFSAEEFKKDLLAKINQKQPESESEAKAFAQKPPLEHFEDDFSGKVATEQGKVTGPLEQKAAAPPSGGVVEKPVGDLPKPVHSPYPKPVDPKLAAPKAKTDQEISLEHENDRLDGAMEENRLSDEQLAESREPSFEETLKARQDAKQKIAEAPGVYRQREAEILEGAEAQAGKALVTELNGMNRTNHKVGGKVFGGQEKTETETEKACISIRSACVRR